MKVAQQAPEVTKRPVYVTSEIYEIWYSKPLSLGKIQNIKGYWYTADQMRFVSSRDAMEYLIRMTEGNKSVPVVSAPEKPVAKQVGPSHPATSVTTSKPKPTLPTSHRIEPSNQNHPRFQEFLEFQRWQAQKKTQSLNQ